MAYQKGKKGGGSREVESKVTKMVLESLVAGTAPWVKPWKAGSAVAVNPLSGTRYRGINTLLLGMAQFCGQYGYNRWATFNQVQEHGWKLMRADLVAATGRGILKEAPEPGASRPDRWAYQTWLRERLVEAGLGDKDYPHVRKGEKASMVVFSRSLDLPKKDSAGRPVLDVNGAEEKRPVFIKKAHSVFNLEQVEGLSPEMRRGEVLEAQYTLNKGLCIELQMALPGVAVAVGGTRAYYSPGQDTIRMPEPERFKDEANYVATLLHEMVHATGHESRLNRLGGGAFGSPEYAREELVAEMGSAFLCAHLGIDGFLQHPEYIGHWVSLLEGSQTEIFRAAAKAQKATDFILDGMGLAEPKAPAEDRELSEAA